MRPIRNHKSTIHNPQSPIANRTLLRPYQRRWVNDAARFALAVKAAQIGFSTATAAWAVDRCLRGQTRLVIFLSRSERQSLELAEKAKLWVDGYEGVVADYFPNQAFGETSILQHELRFASGARIIALPANPDTARGYTGDIGLDEFAFHQDSEAIFMAAFRQVSLGFKMRVLSTPNGQRGKFFDLARSLGLESGIRPRKQPVRASGKGQVASGEQGKLATDHLPLTTSPWSGHWTDIHLAVEEGCPIPIEETRAACDDDTWLQEFCCQFITQGSQWIPPELLQQCVSSEASTVLSGKWQVASLATDHSPLATGLYAGWDIARKRDLSVIWISELVGDVTWTRGVMELSKMSTVDQVREARTLLPLMRRINIDQSGMGLAIFEQLAREFPGKVEGAQFTAPVKERLAVLGKRRMEEGKVRLPDTDAIRHSFMSVKKSVNAIGQARFDAEHDSKYGHGDHWWAFCLAEAAAEGAAGAYPLAEIGGLVGRPVTAGLREMIL